jgi:hypothetical protein
LSAQTTVQAQEVATFLVLWGCGGANFNFIVLNKPVECCFYTSCYFHDGMSWTFIAPLLEYRPATSRWGVMLQAGYDSRKGSLIKCLLHVIVPQT